MAMKKAEQEYTVESNWNRSWGCWRKQGP